MPPDANVVVALALPARFMRADGTPLPEGVATPFVFDVGDLHPRRNLETASPCFGRASDLATFKLVLAGVDRGGADSFWPSDADPQGHDPVRIFGPTDDATLRAVSRHRGARLSVWVRGILAAARRSHGLRHFGHCFLGPVVTEVTGDAAVLLDPDDEPGWAEAIEAVLSLAQAYYEAASVGLVGASLAAARR